MFLGKKLACLGILFVANASWAFGPQRLMDHYQKRAETAASQAPTVERTRSSGTCADFSGHWKGQCLSTDAYGINLYDDEMKLIQDSCDYLYYLDGFSSRNLNGTTKISEISVKDPSYFDAIIYSEWLQGGNLLRGYISMGLNASFSSNNLYMTGAGIMDYSIVNQKLVVTHEDTTYNNYLGTSSSNEVCEYDLIAPMTMP